MTWRFINYKQQVKKIETGIAPEFDIQLEYDRLDYHIRPLNQQKVSDRQTKLVLEYPVNFEANHTGVSMSSGTIDFGLHIVINNHYDEE